MPNTWYNLLRAINSVSIGRKAYSKIEQIQIDSSGIRKDYVRPRTPVRPPCASESCFLGVFHVAETARPFPSSVFVCLQRQAVRMSAEAPLDRAQFLAASAAVATSSAILPLIALAEDEEVSTPDAKTAAHIGEVARIRKIRIFSR